MSGNCGNLVHCHYFFEMNNCVVHLRSDIVDIVIAGRSEGLVACFKLELTPRKFYVDLSNFKIMAL